MSDCRPEDCGPRATRAMMKGGATKGGLPKPAVQEKGRLPSASSVMAMKSSRSSGTLAADLRHSRLKRASSDDALAKPGLGAAAVACRMKKTVTTGAICELADNRPHSLTGVPSAKKSGIPAPREIPPTISRDRSLRTAGSKKMIPSSSSSNLSGLGKSTRTSVKAKVDSEAGDRAGEKAVLECQVKELLAEAKAKEFEISKLRTELQRCKGRGTPDGNTPEGSEPESQSLELQVMALREKNGKFQRELAMLREENQALKEKLLSLGESASVNSPASPTKYTVNGVLQDGSPPKISPSSSSDITKGSSSPDSSEFEKIPSRSDSSCSGPVKGCGDGRRELSVECLTEKIQRMEESHHSTAEELQATLQELSDQQQVMQELTAENERLAEEKVLLQTSLQQQRERVELLTQKNESLLVRLQEQAETDETRAKASRMAELEQRHAELVKNSHFEREKLVDIQQQLTGSLRALEKEHQEAQGLVRSLKEERDTLQTRLEKSQEANSEMVRELVEQRVSTEGLKVENVKLKAQVEVERQKVVELKVMQDAGDSSEVEKLLKVAHSEKERLELQHSELQQELLQATGDTERVRGMLAKVEVECQRLQELCAKQEQEHSTSVRCLEESSHEKEVQIKELKETIFELEDQVEQHRTVRLHTNQTILDLEGQVKKLEEQKLDLEKQLKALSRQMKDETEEWRRFQADLQTAVVVANDIKVEAQQEVRGLRRRLQEEQERNITLEAELEQLQGGRLKGDEVDSSDTDGSPRWCGISVGQMGSPSSEPGATVKSLIKSFDSGVQNGPSHTVAIHSSTRSPLSGIPVRTAPAAAVSPIQRHSSIKPLSKALEKRINLGDFAHPDKLPGLGDDLKPSSLMRKSPSLESVIKSPGSLGGRTASLSYPKANSKLSVERKDPLAALARQYGGSKRNALLKWCQRKTEGYPNIDVTNFSSSWSDGLAFCALLHTYLPAHIPYQELISQDKSRNLTLAFQAAESVGIKPSLDISEMLHTDRPDWQSVMQYVSQIYKYFET
ncbi:cytospin-B isoform X2 [Brienomyrus brachyistius]|uniref:cytospin-B isoform X2 n=1 Tax=Brienomyrus brachyistius TaxID=42636 RepID=UPI0020B44ABF|nr:cytospin-B isoform X2 [Brienomyrus brachyistius]